MFVCLLSKNAWVVEILGKVELIKQNTITAERRGKAKSKNMYKGPTDKANSWGGQGLNVGGGRQGRGEQ